MRSSQNSFWLFFPLSIVKDNQMMAKPGRFQFRILSKNTINKSIAINNKTIESSKSVKLLGSTIGNKLNFGIHINDICKVAGTKIEGLGRISNRLNSSPAKILYNSVILSQSNYCCIAWMFCSKTLQNKINQIQKRALRIVYNEPNLNLDKLVELDEGTTIHIKNIIALLTEVYKTSRGENPIFMNKIFSQKKQYYSLRITNLINFPKVIGSENGTNTFVFRTTHLWNQVPDSIKNEPNAKCFKVKLTRNWQVIKCTCTSCK